jgi:hypothetical protein
MDWKANSPMEDLIALEEADEKRLERKRKAARRKETWLEEYHFMDWLPTRRMEIIKLDGGASKLGWVENNSPATFQDRPVRKARRRGNRDNLVQTNIKLFTDKYPELKQVGGCVATSTATPKNTSPRKEDRAKDTQKCGALGQQVPDGNSGRQTQAVGGATELQKKYLEVTGGKKRRNSGSRGMEIRMNKKCRTFTPLTSATENETGKKCKTGCQEPRLLV